MNYPAPSPSIHQVLLEVGIFIPCIHLGPALGVPRPPAAGRTDRRVAGARALPRPRAALALGCSARAESFPRALGVWSWGWGWDSAGQGMLPPCLLAHHGVLRSRVGSIPHTQGHQLGFGVFILGCSFPKGGLGHVFSRVRLWHRAELLLPACISTI